MSMNEDMGADRDSTPARDPDAGDPADDAGRRAAEKYIDDLLARGEAVYEGEEPTPGTTHVVRREDDGRLTVRRLRFRG